MNAVRDQSIDIARGIAILAIVLGHVLRGLASAGVVDPDSDGVQLTDAMLYTFHLSVFAFVAGLFVQRAIVRDGALSYVVNRDALFIYLYVLWSLLQGGVKLVTGALVNSPTSVADILQLWRPEGQLWFLPFLIVMTTAAAIIRPWRNRVLAVSTVVATVLVSAIVWGTDFGYAGTQGIALSGFFFVGLLVRSDRLNRVISRIGTVISVASIAVMGGSYMLLITQRLATAPTTGGDDRTLLSVLLGILASGLGVGTVLLLSRLLSKLGRAAQWLSFIGTRTLEIFLAHIIAASGARIVLELIGVGSPVVHISVGLIAGVTLPLILWWLGQKLRINFLFDWPFTRIVTAPRREQV